MSRIIKNHWYEPIYSAVIFQSNDLLSWDRAYIIIGIDHVILHQRLGKRLLIFARECIPVQMDPLSNNRRDVTRRTGSLHSLNTKEQIHIIWGTSRGTFLSNTHAFSRQFQAFHLYVVRFLSSLYLSLFHTTEIGIFKFSKIILLETVDYKTVCWLFKNPIKI